MYPFDVPDEGWRLSVFVVQRLNTRKPLPRHPFHTEKPGLRKAESTLINALPTSWSTLSVQELLGWLSEEVELCIHTRAADIFLNYAAFSEKLARDFHPRYNWRKYNQNEKPRTGCIERGGNKHVKCKITKERDRGKGRGMYKCMRNVDGYRINRSENKNKYLTEIES